jgi:4a-hydroxytetrahydrobiopterin dehydratase
MDLTLKKCTAHKGSVAKFDRDQIALLLPDVPGWGVRSERLQRGFQFKDFRAAMAFVNRMADLAEAEGHHPDFTVHYSQVEVEIWTHVASGLTENDFILAAKIGKLSPAG